MPNLQTLLSPAVTLLIGFGVLLFSYRQWRLAKDKFRLDLFEKRYKVYEAALIYLSAVVGLADVRNDDLHNYNRGTMDAVFLFGPDINDYIKEVRRRSLDMQLYQKQFSVLPVGTAERTALVQKNTEELIWLSDQFLRLPLVFETYLGFGKTR